MVRSNARIISNLGVLLEELRDYFDSRMDAKDGGEGDHPRPNREMQLYSRIEEIEQQLSTLHLPMSVLELQRLVLEKSEYKAGGPKDERTALELTCRFVAFHEAWSIRDAWDMKDYVETIQQGHTLGGPFQTVDDLAKWIAAIDESHAEDEGGAWNWLDKALNHFFGIRDER